MSKEKSKKGPENWPTWKLILVVSGTFILFFVLLFLMVSTGNVLLGYIVYGLYILLGLAMVFKAESVGSTIYETKNLIVVWVWKRIFQIQEGDISKRFNKLESTPFGYDFHVWVIFFIGLGLIAISIWGIVMLAQGKMF